MRGLIPGAANDGGDGQGTSETRIIGGNKNVGFPTADLTSTQCLPSDAGLRPPTQSEEIEPELEGGFHSTFRTPYPSARGICSISFWPWDGRMREGWSERKQAPLRMGEGTAGQHMLRTAWLRMHAPQGSRHAAILRARGAGTLETQAGAVQVSQCHQPLDPSST